MKLAYTLFLAFFASQCVRVILGIPLPVWAVPALYLAFWLGRRLHNRPKPQGDCHAELAQRLPVVVPDVGPLTHKRRPRNNPKPGTRSPARKPNNRFRRN